MGKVISISSYREELEKKKSYVLGAMIQYFKDLSVSEGVNIPYFIRAKELYNERIKSIYDLDCLYNLMRGEK